MLVTALSLNYNLFSQNIEVFANGGYQFKDKLKGTDGYIQFDGGATYGLAVDFISAGKFELELNYQGVQNGYSVNDYYYSAYGNDISQNFFMMAGLFDFKKSDKLVAYASIGLGACWFNVKEATGFSIWRFSTSFGAGIKYYANDKIGFRLQTQLMAPIMKTNSSMYGESFGLKQNSALLQLAITAGIVYRIPMSGEVSEPEE